MGNQLFWTNLDIHLSKAGIGSFDLLKRFFKWNEIKSRKISRVAIVREQVNSKLSLELRIFVILKCSDKVSWPSKDL